MEEEDCLYLIMELVSGGELGEWIVKKGAFSEIMGRHIFLQIVEGLLGACRNASDPPKTELFTRWNRVKPWSNW